MRSGSILLAAMCAVVVLAGVAPTRATSAEVVVGVPFWPSAQAKAHIISQALESELGVTAELRQSGTLGIFIGIERGDIQVHPEIRLPKFASVVAQRGGGTGRLELTDRGMQARRGICVTRATVEATGIERISDLARPEIARLFDSDGDGLGEMWIGAATSPSTIVEEIRARSYGYANTMSLLVAPELVAMATVDAAVAVGRPIVFKCQSPHHIFKLHDVVFLEEPVHDSSTWSILTPEAGPGWLDRSRADSAWESSQFHIGYAGSLAESSPEVVKFLRNIDFTPDETIDMEFAVGIQQQAPADYAAAWIAAHRDRVKGWGQ